MEKTQFRLELVKLTFTHHKGHAEAIGEAKALEAYIFSDEPKADVPTAPVPAVSASEKPAETKGKGGGKRAGNPSIFD